MSDQYFKANRALMQRFKINDNVVVMWPAGTDEFEREFAKPPQLGTVVGYQQYGDGKFALKIYIIDKDTHYVIDPNNQMSPVEHV